MELLRVVWRDYRWPFVAVVLLSLASAGLGIGVIAFINQRLLETFTDPWHILPEFLGMIALLLVITLASQLALTTLGHHFVYRLRGQLIKRILDTNIEQVDQIGSARLLASLSTDVRYITVAFVRLPELVQGGVLTVGVTVYLGWLSPSMLAVTALWVIMTVLIGIRLVAIGVVFFLANGLGWAGHRHRWPPPSLSRCCFCVRRLFKR